MNRHENSGNLTSNSGNNQAPEILREQLESDHWKIKYKLCVFVNLLTRRQDNIKYEDKIILSTITFKQWEEEDNKIEKIRN